MTIRMIRAPIGAKAPPTTSPPWFCRSGFTRDRVLKSRVNPLLHGLFLLILVSCLSNVAQAADPLDAWRAEAGRVRILAENDLASAYQAAQRLQATLPAIAPPADRVRLLNLFARIELYQAQTEQTAKHAQQAMALAKQYGDKVGQAEANLNVAMNAINQSHVEEAKTATVDALAELDGVDRPDLLGEAMLRSAMMYRRIGQMDESVIMSMRQLEIARRSNLPLVKTYAYQGLAISYDQSGRTAEARKYFTLMREQARAIPSKLLEADALLGLGGVVSHLGDIRAGEGDIREAIALYRSVGGAFYLSHGRFILADNLRLRHRPAAALPLFDEAAATYEQHDNKIGLWWTLIARSKTQQELRHLAAAQDDAERSHALAKEIGLSLYLGESAKRLAAVAAARGDYRLAYRFNTEATEMAARAARENAGARMVDLAERYEAESEKRHIEELSRRNELQAAELRQRSLQQRWLWTLFGSSFATLVGTAYFLLRLRRSHRLLETADTQVRQSRNKLQATLDAIPDLLFVLGLDGRYYEYHSPRTDLLAAPAETLLGKTVSEVLPPDAADICLSALREAHEKGSSTGKQFELPLPHGKFWFELSVARKITDHGEEPRFIVLSRDITERKRMEEVLHEQGQAIRAVVENSPDMIARYDTECRRIYVNPAMQAQFGLPVEEILGKTPTAFSPLSDAQAYMQMIRGVFESVQKVETEFSFYTPQGATRWGHIRMVPEFGADGEVVSVLAIARDITSLKDAENKIEEAYAQVKELAAYREEALENERKRIARDMHDELGQYLTALRMGISVLRMRFAEGKPEMQEQVQGVMSLLDRTIQVVRDMATRLRPAPLEMGVLSALEWLVEDFSKRTGVQCELDAGKEEIGMSDSQATAIFRIVQESLTNVARYAGAGHVDIRLGIGEKDYMLLVRDDGKGFDPTASRKKSFGLVGIRERAAMLGGEANISSAPGRGVTIEVRIPVQEPKGKT